MYNYRYTFSFVYVSRSRIALFTYNYFIMKLSLKKFVFLGILSLCMCSPISSASAAVFLPSAITLSQPAAVYDAGSTQTIDIVYEEYQTSPRTQIEYGVAREIKRGQLTNFETMSSETLAASAVKNSLQVAIPNIGRDYATSTYVIYVKTFVQDDPDTEHFFITKNFQIKANDASPYIAVSYVTMLNSTGKSFSATAGPTIYNPAKQADPRFSTSTTLELIFESNQDTTLRPELNFGKLRTGDFDTKIDVGEISIKKGITTILVPLPTFEYVPGVYVGKIDFKSDTLKNPIDFQYIVGGDTVTVGTVAVTDIKEGSLATYTIYGSPLDIERLSESRNVKRNTLYDVSLVYMKGDKTVFTEQKDVDFSTTTFSSLIPKNIKHVDTVAITVKSKVSGEVIYTATKDLVVDKGLSTAVTIAIIVLLAVLIAAIIVYVKKHRTQIALVAVFGFALFGLTQIALAWEPSAFVTGAVNAGFANEGVYENPRLYLNQNVSTKQYSVGDSISFLFKASYVYCLNTGLNLYAGFSTAGAATAFSDKVLLDYTAQSQVGFGNGGNHPIYRNTNAFMAWDAGVIGPSTNTLYGYVSEDLIAPANRVSDGATSYAIPLRIGPPAPTLTVTTSAQCGGKIALNWPAVTGATRYDVYQSPTAGGTFNQIASTEQTGYINTVGIAGVTYYYKVKAVGVQTSPFSNVSSATASTLCPDGTPVLSCSATPVTANLGETVHWTSQITNAAASDYNYSWSGAVTGTNQNEDAVYGIEGPRSAWVSATLKSNGSVVYTADCTVNVTDSGIGCDAGMKYCASTLSCIPDASNCPSSCGNAAITPVPLNGSLNSGSAGLCGGTYSLLPGSLFPALSGTSLGAWKWTCTTATPGQTTKIGCAANCENGTSYCAPKDACTATCDTCPVGLRMNEVGECVPPTARIIYFKASPDVSSTTCPAFWNTEVNEGSHLVCTIDPGTSYAQSVPSYHLPAILTATSTVEGSDDQHVTQYGFSEDIFHLSPGVNHKLSCEVRTDEGDVYVKTVSASSRCYRYAKPIEI